MPNNALPTLEHLTTAVMLVDDQSRIAYLNPAAEHLFGLSHTNLIGHPLQYAFTHTEQLSATIQSALASRASHIGHELTPARTARETNCTWAAPRRRCNSMRMRFCWNSTPSIGH
jgi:two-component system nitrogen regulation sensor histidine kinase GlnL